MSAEIRSEMCPKFHRSIRASFALALALTLVVPTGLGSGDALAQTETQAPDAPASSPDADGGTQIRSSDACLDSEKWQLPPSFSKRFEREFERFLSGRSSAALGFSNALALRSQTIAQPDLKLFSEYWIARALHRLGMIHSAYAGFGLILSQANPASPGRGELSAVHWAALECMNRIRASYPSFVQPPQVSAQLARFRDGADEPPRRAAVAEASLALLSERIATNRPQSEIDAALRLLSGSGPWEALARTWVAAHNGAHSQVLEQGSRFLKNDPLPEPLKRHQDSVHLLIARALYAGARYEEAIAHDKAVSKSSNLQAQALQELAWAHLGAERAGEAVGAALALEAGGLRQTFTPEAPMVMAMAFNELCHYPESLAAVNRLKDHYEPAWRWLDNWSKNSTQSHSQNSTKSHTRRGAESTQPLYPLAVRFLRKEPKLDVPVRIASEWVRSAGFQAAQSEINLLFEERESAVKFGSLRSKDLAKTGAEIMKTWSQIQPRIRQERKSLKPGEVLSASLRAEIQELRYLIQTYRRLTQAESVWRGITARSEQTAAITRAVLVDRINRDLSERTRLMHKQLSEIAENNQLIEIEIYNGASQDLVFQNAHPEFKEVARKLQTETQTQTQTQTEVASAERTLDWGRRRASGGEVDGEIWEDELGSFKADLVDQCSSKEKYLALMKGALSKRRTNP